MSELRTEVLKRNLKNDRFGNIVRAHLSTQNTSRIYRLKEETGRYYKDIFRVLLSVFQANQEQFPIVETPEYYEVITFRISRELALFSSDFAWERGEKRAYFFNSIVENFFKRVPFKEAKETFKKQHDRVVRILRGGV